MCMYTHVQAPEPVWRYEDSSFESALPFHSVKEMSNNSHTGINIRIFPSYSQLMNFPLVGSHFLFHCQTTDSQTIIKCRYLCCISQSCRRSRFWNRANQVCLDRCFNRQLLTAPVPYCVNHLVWNVWKRNQIALT